ncbi:unnamed protein product [Prunus armeniaca]
MEREMCIRINACLPEAFWAKAEEETDALHYALNISEGDPTTFQEAVEISERGSWMSAMMDKMESLHQNSIWELDMEVEQMEVKMPFFYGDLEDDIYMSQSQRSLEASKGNLVYRLKKSLYGLKQSPRQWYKRFDTYMLRIRYRRCESDCYVYSHVFKDGKIILLLHYEVCFYLWWRTD